MYRVKCIAPNGASERRSTNPFSENDKWVYGEIGSVEDALIGPYQLSTDSFTVLGHDGAVTAAASTDNCIEIVSGLSAVDAFDGITHQTTFTLSNVAQAIVNGTEYQSTKLFNFPLGRILVEGVVATLQQKTTSAILSTLNGSSTGAISLGTAAASNTTLDTTMVDLLPSTAFTSSATINVAGTAVSAALAASAQFDGTATAKDMYLNTAYATTTDVDANATQTISGHIIVTWKNLGTI
jgi:hypothetical protein